MFDVGLTNELIGLHRGRCSKCDISLNASTWKGVVTVYRIHNKRHSKYLCVRCVQNSKSNTIFKTDYELDYFVSRIEMSC